MNRLHNHLTKGFCSPTLNTQMLISSARTNSNVRKVFALADTALKSEEGRYFRPILMPMHMVSKRQKSVLRRGAYRHCEAPKRLKSC